MVLPFLDDDHVQSGLGQDSCGRSATGARADDDDITALPSFGRIQRVSVEPRCASLILFAVDETAGIHADHPLHLGIPGVAERGQRLQQKEELPSQASSATLQTPKVSGSAPRRQAREPAREGGPLERANGSANRSSDPRRGARQQHANRPDDGYSGIAFGAGEAFTLREEHLRESTQDRSLAGRQAGAGASASLHRQWRDRAPP